MEDTNKPQAAPKIELRWKLPPDITDRNRKIVWDEAAQKRFRELPFSLNLGFKVDFTKLCEEGYEDDEWDEE